MQGAGASPSELTQSNAVKTMQYQAHFLLMATYNRRMNHQVYTAARQLDEAELHQDQGAFFGSVIGTLNHLLVGDLIWLRRFSTHSESYQLKIQLHNLPVPKGLNELMFDRLDTLETARQQVDQCVLDWLANEVQENDFSRALVYRNSQGIASERNFGELLAHLFNHQTHHRGQVSTLLSQLGQDVGATDFLLDIPDQMVSNNK